MKKFILRIASLAAVITFLTCALNGITLMTSIFRSAIVYLITILLAVVTLNVLRWGVWATSPSPKQENEEINEKSE